MRFPFLNLEDARDYILTGIILLFALSLMIARDYDALRTVRLTSITLFSLLEEPLSSVRIYRQALQTNERLQRQNILLLDELSRLRSVDEENRALRHMLGFRDTSKWELLPTRVVGKQLSGLNNSLTINVGKEDGVENGMAFITSEGLVGRVILSTDHYAQVLPMVNATFRASAVLQGVRAYGIVEWEESLSNLKMMYVPKTIPVSVGNIIETSGYSFEFPKGIPIGKVTGVEPEPGKETQIIYFEPNVDFSTLAEGFVVRSQPDSSLIELKRRLNYEY